MSDNIVTQPHSVSCTPSRAARELDLKRSEFELAVHLGRIRTTPDEGGGGRRVPRTEIDRLRSEPGFPETLRESVLAVGTGDGAALMEVPPTRFTRLARVGLVVPVRFYLNRYRAVVWMYLADELRQFAADKTNSFLLTGRTPETLRSQLAAGVDLRARNWRGRHLGFLLRQTDGPWQRAGALAGFLDPLHVAEIVKDPYERAHLNRFRPGPPAHGTPGTPGAHLAEKIMTADHPDEIAWLRFDLERTLDEARADQPAPRPSPQPFRSTPAPPKPVASSSLPEPAPTHPAPTHPAPTHSAPTHLALTHPAPQPDTPDEPDRPTRGLLSRLRRRRST
ncbi:hypothetical protein SAMN04487983_105821 [Streptomyces sp. yr375]|uniref:DUF6397 family protein n=1 Tax=Streptomyces sp. yr375 TaxID=1761906 RepID=UPI0008CDB6F2|nr:DUF6397 family protein [Streptomyces sp. yr375]SES45704.1 hypothetical protein SAMN04487983_105821 [Streptomyces sp. yr375]